MNYHGHRKVGDRLSRVNAGEYLIVPLDVQTLDEAKDIVADLDGVVSFFKIPGWLHLAPGIEDFLDELAETQRRIFWDIKGADIPETMRGYATSAAKRGFKFMTIHGNGEVSDAAIKAALNARGPNLKILMVTVLTSLGDEDIREIYGLSSVEELVDKRLDRALRLGVDGVISSGREADRIRTIANDRNREDLLIVTPGIRPAGIDHEDQKRAVTPFEAIRSGANYLVVGRPIVKADDRREMAQKIIAEMQAAFDLRGKQLS
jgi:orotidine-5'-phosphate decarboxylase